MPPVVVAAGIGAVGAIGGGILASKGASKAASQQAASDQAAINQQNAQYNQSRADFEPYRQAGVGALGQFGNLVGIGGTPQTMQEAIDKLRNSPYYQSLYRNGTETLLQNGAATGGLRGGNMQRSLADFGADTLSGAIQNQLGNLGGLISVGSGATTNLANLGQNNANAISNLTQAQGNAAASGSLAQAGIWSGVLNNLAQLTTKAAYPHGF